ncbi:MAG: chitobiase/beta-hexosaminidase C-terminal domain-containing protein [Lachnospiraceae bacterium]|nr:chitobiase/beta-hexosaminidase C-terminal domain-containing protein [Lachnospiraceae bacterium]
MPDGKLYCEKCGKAVRLVPDYDEFSDDIIPSMVANPDAKDFFRPIEKKADEAPEETKKKKKKPYSKIVTAATLVSICVCALIVFFASRYMMSYEYTKGRAQDAFLSGDYEGSIALYLDAVALYEDDDNIELKRDYLRIAEAYRHLSQKDQARDYYSRVLELDAENDEAFFAITDMMVEDEDYDGLSSLFEMAKTAAQKKKIEDAWAGEVIFSESEGEYDDDLSLSLSSPKGYQIYYTNNGEDPSAGGTLFSEPILLGDGESVIRARAISQTGIWGPLVTKTYTIKYQAPDLPVIIPSGGNYSAPVTVEIMSFAKDATIYYTWDSSRPDANSPRYDGPIQVPEGNNVLSVLVIDKHGLSSEIERANFVYIPVVISGQ